MALRRARPMLGTLVEINLPAGSEQACFALGFAAIAEVQACLSRFDPGSDVAHFNAAAAGTHLRLRAHSLRVLRAALALQNASLGLFDISQGSGPLGWRVEQDRLLKLEHAVTLNLGGIAKGFAVDQGVKALRQAGLAWASVNAGGDLRVFGPQTVALKLRQEQGGGVCDFGQLADGAFATSHFSDSSRSRLSGGGVTRHVSVAAPRCIWADALTKIVAASGDTAHPLLARLGASAWLH
nr:FAD:protein FMN transferase [Roseateles albus]